ncbi:MAG TPA: 2Fe-2S iron-sulfur cluster-binding protein, partial [Candidatus Competibacter sp.]|nr:2Fe-2S iron-sulfur cluster-binding protein [Candidatus Competibacter sp.]
MSEEPSFMLDGRKVPFQDGQTIMAAALAAGVYIPHLCFNPEFPPHGSCRVCLVKVNGRMQASCTAPA